MAGTFTSGFLNKTGRSSIPCLHRLLTFLISCCKPSLMAWGTCLRRAKTRRKPRGVLLCGGDAGYAKVGDWGDWGWGIWEQAWIHCQLSTFTLQNTRTSGEPALSQEGQLLDKKSLRAVLGKTANWSELAKDCIAFANSLGGTLLIGIEGDKCWRRYWATQP